METFDKVKDDGNPRDTFPGGGVRERPIGKGRFDLITPIGLRRLAQHFENGANKYGDRNWEKGLPLSRYLDSAHRHIIDYMEGDRSEDHLVAVAWNALCFIHTEEMIRRGKLPAALNDLPDSYMAE